MSEIPLWLQGRSAVVAAADSSEWRGGLPDYDLSHEVMPQQRTHHFEPDSLEAVVERIVQVFEMEVSHKKDPATWVSMVTERFRTNVNGGPWATAADIAEIGSYNILIGDSVFYRSRQETFDSSHRVFHRAFPGGFFWEVLEVLSPPPVVTFKWRHWGAFEGEYQGFPPNGQTVEMYGISVAKLSDDLRLVEVEHYYDPNDFLGKLTGGCPVAHGES
ncbi:SnoaL-like polyketide cyclase [Sinosporangium album]|uniref:SnoaL-like polyketide cyclase n=1 Tax=Sinosporangium album TaxID=504805 RepID=A0A1G8J9P5_9ACTN|nr:ester cyclase [Sinosporangium album]SDI27965.1 SnoaL-like polyketide cyclase [Sinosporangium album]